jgi:hypothetical protein
LQKPLRDLWLPPFPKNLQDPTGRNINFKLIS